MKIKIYSVIFITAAIVCSSVFAGVTVVKKAAEINPEMYFGGIKNDQDLTNYMRTNLKNCGWFNYVETESGCKYLINGSKGSDKIVIEIRKNGTDEGIKFAVENNNLDNKILSYKLTDAILNKIFNIPGICNSKIAFEVQIEQNKDIYTCNFDRTDINRITNNNTLSIDPAWGLKNNLITYTLYKKTYTDIVGKYLSTGKIYTLASFPGLNNAAAVSPDSNYIALILSKDRQVELYIKELRGNKAIRVTNDRAVEASPCWSPNGKYICYVSDKGIGRPSLYVYDIQNKKTMKISTSGSEAVTPDWSSLGDKIVYSAKLGKQYTLAVYDVKKEISETVNINADGDWMSPSWAPDGRHVVCSRKLNYNSQLYIVDTWTGKSRQLLKYSSNLTSPSWSALYQYIPSDNVTKQIKNFR